MRKFAQGFALLGLVFSVSASATGQRIEPVHPEREHISSSARRQAVLDDLDTLLVGPATPTSIATAPRAIDTDLCQRDVITLDYRHTNDGDPKSPFKPVGIGSVSTEYHSVGYSEKLSASEAQKACQSLDRDKDYWAYSDSESAARLGLTTLKEVAAAVRANRVVSLDCRPLLDARIEARCASEFLSVADHPSSVSYCSEGMHETGRDCFAYDLGAYRVSITRVWSSSGSSVPATAVKLEYQDINV